MTAIILTLPSSNTPKYSYSTVLDGNEYKLSFQYMLRGDSSWHLSIYDKQDKPLLLNVKIVPWFDLLSGFPAGDLPLGELGLECLSLPFPNAPNITLENLSTDFLLVYYTAT